MPLCAAARNPGRTPSVGTLVPELPSGRVADRPEKFAVGEGRQLANRMLREQEMHCEKSSVTQIPTT